MRYKVWVELEGVGEFPSEPEYVKSGELGVLPDPLGEFAALGEARALQGEVVAAFNPAAAETSDAVDRPRDCDDLPCPHGIPPTGPAQCREGHWLGSRQHPVS